MNVRMEKVAALRQLFAEYGYAGDDGPGMTKEALRRMVKYFNKVGPEKFTAAAKKALQSARATQTRIRRSNTSGMSRKWSDIWNRFKARPASASRDQGMDRIRKTLTNSGYNAPSYLGYSSAIERLNVAPYIDYKGRRRVDHAFPKLVARFYGQEGAPTLSDVLRKYQSFQPVAPSIQVRHSVLTPELLDSTHGKAMSNYTLKRLTGGLIDRIKTTWRGIFNPSGLSLGHSIFGKGKYQHVTPRPKAALKYSAGDHLEAAKNFQGYKDIEKIQKETGVPMLMGVMQSRPTQGTVSLRRLQGGSKKLDVPVYGPDYSVEKYNLRNDERAPKEFSGNALVIDKRRALHNKHKELAREGVDLSAEWDTYDHEDYLKALAGGETTYLTDWKKKVYEPMNAADLDAVRRQLGRNRVKWYNDLLADRRVRNMINTGYFNRLDINRRVPITGVRLDVMD
jgi:hypothetical protein